MKQTYTTPAGTVSNLYLDMLKQSHILIAGQTGSGKSVVINGIMHAALFNSPYKVNFILIDPKRVELVEYKSLPHVVTYASEPADMVNALYKAMEITEQRFKVMQAQGIRKYEGANLYVVIDELADLMTTNAKQVTPLLQRLCQIGRAARVHVIAATQCPLSEVIPTKIKVNFDCKVALKTACKRHSVNIMDATGCELLPRYGKCYYITPDRNGIQTVPMVEDSERERIINHWKAQTTTPTQTTAPAPRKGFFARLFA